MPGDRRQILSLLRLPIPPLQPNYSQAGSNLDRVALPFRTLSVRGKFATPPTN